MSQPFPEIVKKPIVRIDAAQRAASALGVYLALSGYLFWPCLDKLSGFKFLLCIHPMIAALGAFFVSRRWVNNWTPSVLTGAIYGFGPFALSFSMYHAVAPLTYVMVPWLLLPSIYWHKGHNPDPLRFCIRALFTLLPFAAIIFMFWGARQQWAGPLFFMPKDLAVEPKTLAGLVFPLQKAGKETIFGLYHTTIILALMGGFVYAKIKRIAALIPVLVGLILSVWEPILEVTPIVWATFPILFLSILCGLGFQSLLWAGKADAKWIVACAIAASVLAAFFGGLALRNITGKVFDLTMMMYAFAAAAMWILFFFVKLNLRWTWFKWTVLTAAAGVDLIFCAKYMIDKLF